MCDQRNYQPFRSFVYNAKTIHRQNENYFCQSRSKSKKEPFSHLKIKFISFLLYPFQFIFQRRCLLAQSKNFSFQNWFLYRLNFKKIFGQIGIGNGRFIRNLFNSLPIDIIQLFDHKIVKNLFMDSSSYP